MTKKGIFISATILVVAAVVFGYLKYGASGMRMILPGEKPPGCLSHGGLAGGCFGTNLNLNFKISGNIPDCLHISSNECDGAELNIVNKCADGSIVTLENVSISKNGVQRMVFGENQNGKVTRLSTSVPPDRDERLVLYGSVDDQYFTVSYTRTASYCK